MALYHHCHIDNSVYDDLVHFHHFFHDLKYGDNDYLFHGALLNAFLCDQSHNFKDFLSDDGAHPLDLKSDHKSSINT